VLSGAATTNTRLGMSTWYEVEDDEIDIDYQDKEVSFFVCNDDAGRVYLSLSFDQLKKIASKLDYA
jgi:hypothetical protein